MWRFREEAALQRSLDVPQVVRVFDYVEEPGRGAAIVMELVDGVSLHEMIGQRGPASPEAALAVLKGSLLGLAAAHSAGIVHRDYKPENVLVDADGSSKLADFGVAVKAGKRLPTAGTPLYMAPEQWNGAPSSPATDIYAAAAVFFECLTGKTPFSGRLPQLRQQHEDAAVPADEIPAAPLRGLIVRGMAKNPADRPQDAIAFVSELESVATAVYGADWEERGRGHLAVRAAALLPLLLLGGATAGSSGTSAATSWLGGRTVLPAGRVGRGGRLGRLGHVVRRGRGGHQAAARRKALAVASVATAVVVAAALTAVAMAGNKSPAEQLTGSSSAASTTLPAVQADVLPPVAASHCTTPTPFSYRGMITATAPGPVTYQWVYSSGQRGPVQSVDFAEAGDRQVTGETVKAKTAGTGWAEVKMISPAAKTSNKASYKLLCAHGATGVSASAAVQPAAKTVTCGTPVPTFTATGTITSRKAQTVTYYWSLSDGRSTAPATMTFTRPGTRPAQALTITPQGDPASGEAVLVATSPVAVSAPAPYTLSCDMPLHLAASAAVSPASATLASCTAAAPAFTFSGTISDNHTGTVSYYWELPSGNGPVRTLSFARAGTQTVTSTYRPAGATATGSGSVVVTSPGSATSNAATFTLKCTAATATSLAVAANAPATATSGQAYSGAVTVSGGTGPYTWAAATGLPTGLTAAASGGTLTISGTPTQPGTFTIGVSVSDAESPVKTATASIPVTVGATPPTLTADAPAAATSGQAYSGTVTVSGGTGPYAWAAATGLPTGLTAAAASGGTLTISGTPTQSGPFTIGVSVSDSESPAKTATTSIPLTVSAPALAIVTASLPSGETGDDYAATVTAAGGTGGYSWSAAGLPDGVTMDSATGEITGTLYGGDEVLDHAGTYPVSVTVRDAATSATKTLNLVVTPRPLTIELNSLVAGTSGAAYTCTFNADYGTAPYSWSAAGLPAGLSISSLSSYDAQITGTPPVVTAATTYSVTITVTDSAGAKDSATLNLVINPAPAGAAG
jgi:serine/threonine-protein kinase